MNRDDVDILKNETAFQGYFRLAALRLRHALYQGGTGPEKRLELFHSGDSACCLPYDPVRDEVVLTEQFRVSVYAAGDQNCWLIETTAGMTDGTAPAETARREALEEAGCVVTDLEHVTDLYPSPGSCSGRASLYIGRTSTEAVGGVHGLDDEVEDIRVFAVPFDEAIRMVDQNEIRVLDTATMILWLDRHRDALRQKWS